MSAQATMVIRSYGVCFSLERRIHKLDRWRIPVPYGIPLRGIAYFAAAFFVVLVATRLPVFGALLGALHPALRFGGLPLAVAAGLMRWSVDGRPAHLVMQAWLRFAVAPKRLIAFRAAPRRDRVTLDDVVVAPDERSAQLRRGVVDGPATVIVRYPVAARPRGRTLHVQREAGPALWRGKQVELQPGQRMVVR
jgi:hypothetical protein